MYGVWYLELYGRFGNFVIIKEVVMIYDKLVWNVKNFYLLNGRIYVVIGVLLDMCVIICGGESDGIWLLVICLFYFFFKKMNF